MTATFWKSSRLGKNPRRPRMPASFSMKVSSTRSSTSGRRPSQFSRKCWRPIPRTFAHTTRSSRRKRLSVDLYKNLLPPDKVPYLLIPVSLLKKFELTHREGYVASRIDGTWDVRSIVTLSPLPELEVLRTLQKLITCDVVALISRPLGTDTPRGQSGSRRQPKERGTKSY